MPGFPAHGDFECRVDGRIIHMHVAGPTNVERMEEIGVAVEEYLNRLDGACSGALVEVGELAILTPEATALCNDLMIDHMKRGLCVIAFVVHARDFRDLIIGNVGKLYDSVGLRWARFESVEEANAWLRERTRLADDCCV